MPYLLSLLLVLLVASQPLTAADQAPELVTHDREWCVIRLPKGGQAGQPVTGEITIKAKAITQASRLHVDLHKFVGLERRPGAGHAQPVELAANVASQHAFTFTVPADASAIAFVCYVVPLGKSGYGERSHATEAGVPISR